MPFFSFPPIASGQSQTVTHTFSANCQAISFHVLNKLGHVIDRGTGLSHARASSIQVQRANMVLYNYLVEPTPLFLLQDSGIALTTQSSDFQAGDIMSITLETLSNHIFFLENTSFEVDIHLEVYPSIP